MEKVTKDFITLCKEEGITMNQLAKKLGCNRATVRERKNNPGAYTVREIIAISTLLKRTPTAIVKIVLREIQSKE